MTSVSPASAVRAHRRPVTASIRIAIVVILLPVMAATAWIISARHLPVPAFETVRAAWRPSAAYLVDRHGQVLAAQRVDFGARRLQWVPLESISPALLSAVIDAEDRRFHQHHGVDLRALPGALYSQLLTHHPRGASTLSMQLATLLEPPARRSTRWEDLPRKWRQARLALALEAHWNKPQILEAYLNLVQFRGEVQGIGAAAQVLAGREPAGLDAAQGELLAAFLPEPGAPLARVLARACARAFQHGRTSCEQIRGAAPGLTPGAAPEATDVLAPQLAARLLTAPGERVRTTLDARIQRLARDILRSRLSELADRNVRDGAALVVDNASGEVLAYVGSAGPASRSPAVDGVRAPRQAGSTLKPFLYELAIERRWLTAASLLEDAPLTLDTGTGIYLPQDYDHEFKGLVSVRTALAGSLNVPAVRTLVLTGVEPFRARLQSLGYDGLTEDGSFYGYSLALGSAEVTLWQQAQGYRTLARGGRGSPLRLLADEPAAPDRTLLAAPAAFIVGDILSDPAARSLSFGLDNHLNTPFWSAAKTGTSKDMRDNWCVGFSRDYTVAVWVGNFEGDPMHEVSGVTGAAPAWHDILVALQREQASQRPSPPAGVIAGTVRFDPAAEPARREWFLEGSQLAEVRAVAATARIARLTSPANGMIIALDPDIPPRAQAVPVRAQGAGAGMMIRLDGTMLGPAAVQHFWTPVSGAHQFALLDEAGRTLDRIRVTVR